MRMNKSISENVVIRALLSSLDKGIDDVEAGRLHTVDSAFRIVRDRVEKELEKNDR